MTGSLLRDKLVPVYAVGVLGAILQAWGGYWDISWHVLGIVETFFTPPHMVLYTGIGLGGLASLLGVVMRYSTFRHDVSRRPLFAGLQIAFVGATFQGIAGPMDLWWHGAFGFDPFLFTPSHSLLILGIVLAVAGMAIGAVRIREARMAGVDLGRLGPSRGIFDALAIAALATLMLALFAVVFLLTDLNGIAYTFHLSEFGEGAQNAISTVAQAGLAFTGTLVLLSAKRIFGARGAALSVAAFAAAIMGSANLGFRAVNLSSTAFGVGLATFLPMYFSFLGPIAILDFALRSDANRVAWLAGAALVGPFAGFLEGYYSAAMWINPGWWVALNVTFMLLGGLLAGLLSARLEGALFARERVVSAAAA